MVTFRAEGDFESTAADVALCLYRVAQEALRNVVTHAGARHAEVRLFAPATTQNSRSPMTAGGSISPSTCKRVKGLGLVSINERVRLAGGTVSIVTELQKGTRVRVQVPVNRGVGPAPLPACRDPTPPRPDAPRTVDTRTYEMMQALVCVHYG